MEIETVDKLVEVFGKKKQQSLNLAVLQSALKSFSKAHQDLVKKASGLKEFLLNHHEAFVVDGEIVYLMLDYKEARIMNEKVATLPEAAKNIINDLKASGLCMICSDTIKIYAFGKCFHPICYKCSTKLRVLCKDLKCSVCREELKSVWYTKSLLPIGMQERTSSTLNGEHGIIFQSNEVKEEYLKLMEHDCTQCKSKFKLFQSLSQHMQMKHNMYFCSLCLKHYKDFTFERKVYTVAQLKRHEEVGDEDGAMRGHPKCEFCNKRYLDNDELFRHLKREHYSCYLCVEDQNAFYATADELWKHFGLKHYFCGDIQCRRDPSCVFETAAELEEHRQKEHTGHSSYSTVATTSAASSSARPQSDRLQQYYTSLGADDDERREFVGEVISVSSYFGFIKIDGISSYEESIYFHAPSLGLELYDNITHHIKMGDRVHVWAEANPGHRTKWRAESVEIVPQDFMLNVSASQPVNNRSAAVAAAPNTNVRRGPIGNTAPHPSNGLHKNFAAAAAASSSSNEWQVVAKKQPQATNTEKINGSNGLTAAQKKCDIPWEGYAFVLQSTSEKFGFLRPESVPSSHVGRNIYFDLSSYGRGIDKFVNLESNVNLKEVFKVGEKVFYRLQEQTTINKKASCKYKADLIKKMDAVTKTNPFKRPNPPPAEVRNIKPPAPAPVASAVVAQKPVAPASRATTPVTPAPTPPPADPTPMVAPALEPISKSLNATNSIQFPPMQAPATTSSYHPQHNQMYNGFTSTHNNVVPNTIRQTAETHLNPIQPTLSEAAFKTTSNLTQENINNISNLHISNNEERSLQCQPSKLASHIDGAGDNKASLPFGPNPKPNKKIQVKIFIDETFKHYMSEVYGSVFADKLQFDVDMEVNSHLGVVGLSCVTFDVLKPVTLLLQRQNRSGKVAAPLLVKLHNHRGIGKDAIKKLVAEKLAFKTDPTDVNNDSALYYLPGCNHYIHCNFFDGDLMNATLHYVKTDI